MQYALPNTTVRQMGRAIIIGAIFLVMDISYVQADIAIPTQRMGVNGLSTSSSWLVTDNGISIGIGRLDATTYRAFRWTPGGGPMDLGTLGGTRSYPYGVTSDGSVIVGLSRLVNNTSRAFRWTAETGMVSLGTLGGTQSYGSAISPDGSVIVGDSLTAGNISDHLFRWTQETGMVDLGSIGGSWIWAVDLSTNGNVIAGYAENAGGTTNVFRWTQEGGIADLGGLGGTYSEMIDISADGSTLVGFSRIAGDVDDHAFKWTPDDGMVDIGTLGGSDSYAWRISSDGKIIVGDSRTAGNAAWRAYRWTQQSGMVDLGTLGGTNSSAYGMTPDGSIIVGDSQIVGNVAWRAYRWSQEKGMEDLHTLLGAAGVDLTGVTLTVAQNISPNGKYIVGYGSFPGSAQEAYLVCYDPNNGCVGVTTQSLQQQSTEGLAASQQTATTEVRATANALLNFTRPMTNVSQTYSGAMFGSAMGYLGGQFVKDKVTLLGGVSYGAQESPNVEPENTMTVATGVRYKFDSLLHNMKADLSPFVEIGGWLTPRAEMKFTRPYANGKGSNIGVGNTQSTSWSEYTKAGLVWNVNAKNQFTGYCEFGLQHMIFEAYAEVATLNNPFPAQVDSGEMQYNVSRVGGSWTHQLDTLLGKPVSFTLAGAMAHSFNVRTNVTTTVPGVGITKASAGSPVVWGEFGGRLEGEITDNLALNIDISGTSGSNGMGTSVHGGFGVGLKF